MRVKDLIELLQDAPQDAFVVIQEEIVHSIEIENGRDKTGYMINPWLSLEHGNRKAVRFTYMDEICDGSLIERKY